VIEWVTLAMGLVAGIAIVWALKERQDATEWARVCVILGEEYDKVQTELAQRGQPLMNVVEQKTRWLN
jgi:hypothetical protein